MRAKEMSINELRVIQEIVAMILNDERDCSTNCIFCKDVFGVGLGECPRDLINTSKYKPLGCKDEITSALDALIIEKESENGK